jgi:hypothetical protein
MTYVIGTAGVPWGASEKQQWYQQQRIQRSYQDDIVSQIEQLGQRFKLTQYGELNYAAGDYPLYVLTTELQSDKPTVLVTGGIHGYETSGVLGALQFLDSEAEYFSQFFNVVVVPCVSPWGYETINRWNPAAVDPNRSFKTPSPAPEAAQLMAYMSANHPQVLCHIDLHETTDTDNSEFRPALAARDAKPQSVWTIPDGYYGVGDSANPQPQFQAAIIAEVASVTHIAEADDNGCLIGVPIAQFGVINYDVKPLGLCASLTNAAYVTTTEVYPDSPRTNPQQCIDAQVAAIRGGLNYLIQNNKLIN